jgi:hypothetical protein
LQHIHGMLPIFFHATVKQWEKNQQGETMVWSSRMSNLAPM